MASGSRDGAPCAKRLVDVTIDVECFECVGCHQEDPLEGLRDDVSIRSHDGGSHSCVRDASDFIINTFKHFRPGGFEWRAWSFNFRVVRLRVSKG